MIDCVVEMQICDDILTLIKCTNIAKNMQMKNKRYKMFEVIVQIRVGGLPPISKHREELKLQSESEHFNELRAVLKSEEVLLMSI